MIKQLREKRAGIVKDIRALADKLKVDGYEFTADERSKFDALETECRQLEQKICDMAKADELDAEMASRANDPTPGREDRGQVRPQDDRVDADTRATAMQAWLLRQSGRQALTEKQQRAMDRGIANCSSEDQVTSQLRDGRNDRLYSEGRDLVIPLLNTREFRQLQRERRALGDAAMTLTTTAGGYAIPEGFVPNVERAMLAFGNVLGVADVIRTASGNDLPWPSLNDTSNAGEASTINTAWTADAKPTLGQLVLKAFKADSQPLFVPYELMEDNAINLEQIISELMGERLGRYINAQLTTGVGTTAPSGVVTGAYAGVTAAAQAAVTPDELLSLLHSVDPSYRDAAYNCGWMFKDATLLALKQVKDGQGRYLFPELRLPEPRHEGFPVFINQQMATIAHSAVPILFGAFRKYKVRIVNGIRVRRLVERYADLDQEAFVGYIRFDGGIHDAGTHPIKKLTMA